MSERKFRVSRGSSETGAWEMYEAPVRADLRPLMHRLCGFAEDTVTPIRRTELPGRSCVLIISFGSPYRLESPSDSWQPLTPGLGFVGGLGEQPTIDIADGAARCVQVDLTPIGMYRLFGIPMSELSNRVVAIEDVLGSAAAPLSDKLESVTDWPTRLELVERALWNRIDQGPAVDRRVAWAWDQLSRSGGNAEVGVLAGQLEISRKHLIDLFRTQIGLPPKRMARLIRFSRVIELAQSGSYADWVDLAQRGGYFDQSHFINDVQRFAGCSPSRLFDRSASELSSVSAL